MWNDAQSVLDISLGRIIEGKKNGRVAKYGGAIVTQLVHPPLRLGTSHSKDFMGLRETVLPGDDARAPHNAVISHVAKDAPRRGVHCAERTVRRTTKRRFVPRHSFV